MSDIKKYLVDGYIPTIGIECHVQLKTNTKLFAPVSNDAKGAEPNTLVSHICFGLPGALPVLNKEALKLSAKAAFALGTSPQKFSKFDRKHYFYPDLPKGYQISQFDEPIIIGGQIKVQNDDGTTKTINITRAHIEEDAGKSTHPANEAYSLVDLNRAGTPLLEIVSEPEMHNAKEAKAFAKELWLRMKYSGVSDVDLYHGNMRFDVNVSVSKNPEKMGIRSETKNLNSFKSVEKAVDYEINRQIKLLEKGDTVVQETRGWLDDKQKTVSQRSKEDAHDYRYFPDPDIPPILLTDEYIKDIEDNLPIMPSEWRSKLSHVGLDNQTIEILLESNVEFESDFLEMLINNKSNAKQFANWIVNIEVPLLRETIDEKKTIEINNNSRQKIYKSVDELYRANKLSSNNAKNLLTKLLRSEELPNNITDYAEKQGYIQISDTSDIEKAVEKVMADNPKAVEDIKKGELKVIGFLVGQVMKASKGKANPAMTQEIIRKKIK